MVDVIVVGLGAVGSAAAYHLTLRGRGVIGLDRFAPPHAFGSSHGQTRIIREAYFEHPLYVPLVQRAYELWADLERDAARALMVPTGGVMIGSPESDVVRGTRRSAEEHGLRHEVLPASEVRRRFPALRPTDDMAGVWESRAAVLFPEACIAAHLDGARRRGAIVRSNERVLGWEASGAGVRVTTEGGAYAAAQLVLTAGSWMRTLLPDWELPLSVERQVLVWLEPKGDADVFRPERCPIHIWEHEPNRYFYGFPDFGDGVKVAVHHEGAIIDPDTIDREIHDDDVEAVRRLVRRYMPGADGPLRSAAVCMYTNTPDGDFLVDRHPGHPRVLVASACSGHGFKFSSALGEILADLATNGEPRFDVTPFRNRFA